MSKSRNKSFSVFILAVALTILLTSCKKDNFSFGYFKDDCYINEYLGIGLKLDTSNTQLQYLDYQGLYNRNGIPEGGTYGENKETIDNSPQLNDAYIQLNNNVRLSINYYNKNKNGENISLKEYADLRSDLIESNKWFYGGDSTETSLKKDKFFGYDCYYITCTEIDASIIVYKCVLLEKDNHFCDISCFVFDDENMDEVFDSFFKLS